MKWTVPEELLTTLKPVPFIARRSIVLLARVFPELKLIVEATGAVERSAG